MQMYKKKIKSFSVNNKVFVNLCQGWHATPKKEKPEIKNTVTKESHD